MAIPAKVRVINYQFKGDELSHSIFLHGCSSPSNLKNS
jgi:hypothetical protein